MSIRKLGALQPGESATISRVIFTEGSTPIATRMMELGLLEGSRVEVLHQAPLSHDPIAIRVRGTLIALRLNEADLIEVL